MPQYCLIKHRIENVTIDGADSDRNPDRMPVTGMVTFEALLDKGDSVVVTEDGVATTITLAPIEARITNGEIYHRAEEGVKLFAGGPDTNPEKIRYKATFHNLIANGKKIELKPILFEAVPGGEITLSMAQPVPGKPYPGYSATIEQGITQIADTAVSYLDQIQGARDEALGTVGDAVAAEVDTIRWWRGQVPDDATLDGLRPGTHWVASSAAGQALGLPTSTFGSLTIVEHSTSFKTAFFVSIGADHAVWTNRKNSDAGWNTWTRIDAGILATQLSGKISWQGKIPDASDVSTLADGVWERWQASAGVGLPKSVIGLLTKRTWGTAGLMTFITLDPQPEIWVKPRSSGEWGTWSRTDAGSGAPAVPVGATLDSLRPGSHWVATSAAATSLGLPNSTFGSLSIVEYTASYKTALFVAIGESRVFSATKYPPGGWGTWTRIDAGAGTTPTPVPDPGTALSTPSDLFPDPNAPLEADLGRVVMWGDSLTWGGHIRNRLAALEAGVDFVNEGAGGQTALQIAARQGGGMATIEVDGDTIPESGAVAVSDISQRVLFRTGMGAATIAGTIHGVHGTLSNTAGTEDYTFTRSEAGLSVPIPDGTLFVPDDAIGSRHDAQIIWVGRNNAGGSDPVLGVRSMLQWLSPARKRVAVISLTGDSTWKAGTWQYRQTATINAQIERMCGDSYVDVRRWLIDHGLDAAGIDPTQDDLDAIDGDAIPPSLTTDGTHFLPVVQTAIGTWLHGELAARGWWSTSA